MKNQHRRAVFVNCHRCGVAMEDLTRKFCVSCIDKMRNGATPDVNAEENWEKEIDDLEMGCESCLKVASYADMKMNCGNCNAQLRLNRLYAEHDPCYMCQAGECEDCCANCSVRYPVKYSKKAGEVTIMGTRDEYGGL